MTERRVEAAIDGGARTIADLQRACGAGQECGGCHSLLAELLDCDRPAGPSELVGAITAH